MFSPLLGKGKYCGEVLPAALETTGHRLFVRTARNAPYFRLKLNYRLLSNTFLRSANI